MWEYLCWIRFCPAIGKEPPVKQVNSLKIGMEGGYGSIANLKENSPPPRGYKAKPGSGACRCRGSGYGIDSCGTLCCAASPYTSTDPSSKYYYKKGGSRGIANLCFEKEV